MNLLYIKKSKIRSVITMILATSMLHSISLPHYARAEQLSTESIITQQMYELEVVCTEDNVPEEPISVESMIPSISQVDVPTVTMVAEEIIEEQVEVQQHIMKEEEERIRLEKIAQEEAKRQAQIDRITADPNDISKVSNLTEEQYSILVEGTWWEGREQILIDLEKYYGINAFFAMSVSTLESGKGTSHRAQTKQNYYGAEVSRVFEGLYDNTMYFGDFMNRLYVDDGLTSVWSIGPKYCPPNRNWEVYMANNMQELYNKVMVTLR